MTIVQFLTPQPLDWRPPEFAVTRAGGSVELAMLGTRKTTRAGRVGKSRWVRLELEVEREALRAQVEALGAALDRFERGELVVCDARLISSSYGHAFLNSLPAMPVTTQLADVEKFYSSRIEEAVA